MNKKGTQQQAQEAKVSLDGQYPGLNGLSWAIGYLEAALAIISEPLLIGCASLAVIDFITAGRLLAIPFIMYLWAGSLAIAVTACFIVTWRRAIRAFSAHYYGAGIGLGLLGLALGVVDWAAIDVQSLQQTLGVSFISALAQLNLNIIFITHVRSAVAIAMAVVVAVSNHTAVSTAVAPKRRLVFLDKMMDKIAPVVDAATVQSQVVVGEVHAPADVPLLAQSVQSSSVQPVRPTELKAVPEPIERVRQALSAAPDASDRQIAKLSNVSPTTAGKYRKIIESGQSEAV